MLLVNFSILTVFYWEKNKEEKQDNIQEKTILAGWHTLAKKLMTDKVKGKKKINREGKRKKGGSSKFFVHFLK